MKDEGTAYNISVNNDFTVLILKILLAKSKNGHGQSGQNGQTGQKIGQTGHRTDITYCFYYIITFFKTFLVWFAVCDKYYF